MSKAHLAILPNLDGRRAERRLVNIAAGLREPGASLNEIEVVNLSVGGFAAHLGIPVEMGATVWLKLPGIEPVSCRVAWVEEGKAGFEFTTPLHQATLDLLTLANKKPVIKRHFGIQGAASKASWRG